MSQWKVERMGSGVETDTQSPLASLQSWQGWSTAVCGMWWQLHTSCRCGFTTQFLKALGVVARVSGHLLWLQQVTLCLAAHPPPTGIQTQKDFLQQLGPHYSAVVWACLQRLRFGCQFTPALHGKGEDERNEQNTDEEENQRKDTKEQRT